MKRLFFFLPLIACLSLLIGCSAGGGGDPAVTPNGYKFTFFPPTPTNVLSLALSADKNTLFVGTGGGLFSAPTTAQDLPYTRVIIANGDNVNNSVAVNALLLESDGNLLIGTDVGLFRRNATTGTVTTVTLSLKNLKVLSIAKTSDNTIWAGLADLTAVKNLLRRKSDGTETFYGMTAGLVASNVVSIYTDSTVTMVCGTGSVGKAGLFKANSTFTAFTQNPDFTDDSNCFSVIDGKWYAGSTANGLQVSSDTGNSWALIAGTNTSTPYSINTSSMGQTWITSDKGLYLTYDMSTFYLLNSASRLGRDLCKSFALYGSDNLYTPLVFVGHPDPTGGVSRGSFTGD